MSRLRQIIENVNSLPMGIEAVVRLFYSSVLQEGDIAIDGGSADGLHTNPMSRIVGKSGLVIAVEPLFSEIYSKRKWVGNYRRSNIRVVEAALSDYEGSSEFLMVKSGPGWSGLKQGYWDRNTEPRVIEVPVTTIDSLISQLKIRTPKFIKLDLEGGEYDAIRGSREVLKRGVTTIVFENAPKAAPINYGYLADDLFSFPRNYGYRMFDIFGNPYTSAEQYSEHTPNIFVMVPKDSTEQKFVSENLPKLLFQLIE